MRYVLTVLLIIAWSSSFNADQTSALDSVISTNLLVSDPASISACDFGDSVSQIARAANIPLGIEDPFDCRPGGRALVSPNAVVRLTDMTARQALDHVTSFQRTFRWIDMDGVAVVRPERAWYDPKNVLNLPTKSFEINNTHVHYFLHALSEAVTPSVSLEHVEGVLSSKAHGAPSVGDIDRAVTVSFSGGTMLDALNTVAMARRLEWHLAYPDRDRAVVMLATVKWPQEITMAPLALSRIP